MKATELRIGNIIARIDRTKKIHLPVYVAPMKILEIELFKCQYYNYDQNPALVKEWYMSDLNDISGIPITDEWLIMFGFEFDENKGFKYSDDDGEPQEVEDRPYWFVQYKSDDFTMRFIWYPDDRKANSCPCNFVHQIQNAYFALTGEELLLKTEAPK
jgi:hypothetical protein